MKKYIMLTPGPANISDRVAKAQLNVFTCHREKNFVDLMRRVRNNLVKIANGTKDYTSVLFTSSGTGAVESAISSCIDDSSKALILNNGPYCQRMTDIAKIYSIKYLSLDFGLGKKIDIKKVEEILIRDKKISHIAMVHHETETGILNDIHAIGKLSKKYGKIFIVDAMSSFGAEDIDVVKDNIDFCIASSNKCIQGPPGISFVIAKIKELEKLKDKKRRNFYLSLYDQFVAEENDSPRFTPATQTLHGFDEAIKEYFEEGFEKRKKRYYKTADIIRKGLENIGFEILIEPQKRAGNITAFKLIDEIPYEKLRAELKKKGYIIRSKVKENNTFRIANLGTLTEKEAERFVKVFNKTFNEMF